jgi:hypothetical protein
MKLPLSQTSKNAMFFFLSFLFFSSTKSEVGGVVPAWGSRREISSSGRGELVGKGGRRVSMVPKMYTPVYKCKNDTC